MRKALLASGNQAVNEPLVALLGGEFEFDCAADGSAFFRLLAEHDYDLLFVDHSMIDGSHAEAEFRRELESLVARKPAALIFVLHPRKHGAESALLGSAHYLTYPLPQAQLRSVVGRILQAHRIASELAECRPGFLPSDAADLVAFSGPKMQLVLERARAVAGMDSTVLLTGETGTGKGVLARLIHCWSQRRTGSFVAIQCSAIPDALLESELFGHEKGAFTDAVRTRTGKFEAAQGGTLFLDEIGTISLATQVKLLQVLQERSFHRVGGEKEIKTNARIVAATNSDLKRLITQEAFRRDLYYRLNVFPIEVPPLRDRREDIPALAHAFLRKLNRAYPKNILGIDAKTLETLQEYSWPGNIRELENLIERAFILEPASILTPHHLNFEAGEVAASELPEVSVDPSLPLSEVRSRCLAHVERAYLEKLLAIHGGKIAETAAAAGIGTRQLHNLLTRHRLSKEDFRKGANRK